MKIIKAAVIFNVIIFFLCSLILAQDIEKKYPQRIISLAPNITEILFKLGVGDSVVGVTDFCRFPAEAQNIPKIGGVLNTNVEKVISLKPDLIIMMSASASLEEKLKGIINTQFLTVKNETIADVMESIILIGEKTGKSDQAREVASQISKEISEIKKKYEKYPKKRVLCVVDKTPASLKQMYVAGKDTFLTELVESAGGVNIVDKSIARYPVISKEDIIHLNPEVILDFSLGEKPTDQDKKNNIKTWSVLETLSAVKTNSIYTITDPRLTIQGPELAESIKILAEYLHKNESK